MNEESIVLTTPDGDCPCQVFSPGDGDAQPAVIFFMDGLGIRPTLFDMGRRLASYGYVVLLPDLYYRGGGYTPLDVDEIFASGDLRAALAPKLATTDTARATEDTGVFLDYLASRPDVAGTQVGTTGYCLGGGISLAAAGAHPERIAAAASFHGGRLVTDSELSPSRNVRSITARVYVAGADFDDGYPPEMADELERLLTEAGVDHRLEVYTGARHGFAIKDFPVYDEQAAERHWRELVALLEETLKQGA